MSDYYVYVLAKDDGEVWTTHTDYCDAIHERETFKELKLKLINFPIYRIRELMCKIDQIEGQV